MHVKDIPKEERPRERFLSVGASCLTNQELLAILLKTGTRSESAMDLAFSILNQVGNVSFLKDISVSKLMSIKGIGLVKAIEISSAVELGKRIYFPSLKHKEKLMNAKEIYENSKSLFVGKMQEEFYCLYFNHKQELIERKLLFMGTINRSVVHPREVFKEAYLTSASSIVCIHNHPSGDTKPSREDIIFTKSLVEIGRVSGIPVVDHIIVGDHNYYSFYENNNVCNL